MKTTKHIAALLAALVLALSLTACGQTAAKDDPMNPAIPVADGAEIGEGSKTFTTEVADQDGKAVTFTVHTDEETVGRRAAEAPRRRGRSEQLRAVCQDRQRHDRRL